MIELIATVDSCWGIGLEGKIPWYMPQDARWFEQQTRSHVVICGRRTHQAHRLPHRKYFVLSRKQSSEAGRACYPNLASAVATAEEFHPDRKIFVIGGAEVYAEALRSGLVGALHLTRVAGNYQCDRFFPYEELARASLKQVWVDNSYTPDKLVFEKWLAYGYDRQPQKFHFTEPSRR